MNERELAEEITILFYCALEKGCLGTHTHSEFVANNGAESILGMAAREQFSFIHESTGYLSVVGSVVGGLCSKDNALVVIRQFTQEQFYMSTDGSIDAQGNIVDCIMANLSICLNLNGRLKCYHLCGVNNWRGLIKTGSSFTWELISILMPKENRSE